MAYVFNCSLFEYYDAVSYKCCIFHTPLTNIEVSATHDYVILTHLLPSLLICSIIMLNASTRILYDVT